MLKTPSQILIHAPQGKSRMRAKTEARNSTEREAGALAIQTEALGKAPPRAVCPKKAAHFAVHPGCSEMKQMLPEWSKIGTILLKQRQTIVVPSEDHDALAPHSPRESHQDLVLGILPLNMAFLSRSERITTQYSLRFIPAREH